ncbi:MAG TPA: hypothetical protein VF790_13280 [Dissulfurispiraceae bacterium]
MHQAIPVLAISFALCLSARAFAIEPDQLSGKVAYLKSGEVLAADADGLKTYQLTRTGGRVEEFLFAPSLRYLAYSKLIGHAAEQESEEEERGAPRRAVYSIVVLDLAKEEPLTEIMPREGEWIYPSEWLPGDRLLYYSVSGLEVSGFFEYNARTGTTKEVSYRKPGISSKVNVSGDGTLMLYVEDTGAGTEHKEQLHLASLESDEDKVLVTRENIESPRISHNKKHIAFVEMEKHDSKYFAGLWLYTLKGGALQKVFARAEEGASTVSWALDDKHLGMWSPPDAFIIDPRRPGDIRRILGADFHWISGGKVIFSREGDIYVYRLENGREELFAKTAAKPVFLAKKSEPARPVLPKLRQ